MSQRVFCYGDVRQYGGVIHILINYIVYLHCVVILHRRAVRPNQQGVQHKGRAITFNDLLCVRHQGSTVLEPTILPFLGMRSSAACTISATGATCGSTNDKPVSLVCRVRRGERAL